MLKKLFLSCLLLPLIINVNTREQIKITPIQLAPNDITEQYYQYTINNQVNEKYGFFNRILNISSIIDANNPILLKKYRQLENNWERQYYFTINKKRSVIYTLLLVFSIFLIFFVLISLELGFSYKIFKKNCFAIADYFKFNNQIEKFLKNKSNREKFFYNAFYATKFFMRSKNNMELFIKAVISNWKKNNANRFQDHNIDLENLFKKIYCYDFYLHLQAINFSYKFFIPRKFVNYSLPLSNGDASININELSEETFEKIYVNSEDYNHVYFKHELIENINNIYQLLFLFINNFTIPYTENALRIKTDAETKIYASDIAFDELKLKKNSFSFFNSNDHEQEQKNYISFYIKFDQKFLNFIKKDFFIAQCTFKEYQKKCGEKYLKNNHYQNEIDKLQDFVNIKAKMLLILPFFWLVFINFFITHYLFNGYQYLINTIKIFFKKDVIKINGFTYVKEKDCFYVDDGFVINKNGVNYYRLSSLLNSRTIWQLIMQIYFDFYVIGFYYFLYYISKTAFCYYSWFFIFGSITMIVYRILAFICYCNASWQYFFYH